MSRGIIVGYDGSECAKAALRTGLDLGRTYAEPVIVAFGYELSPVGGELHDYEAAVRELADRRVGEAAAIAQDAGAEVEPAVLERDPAHGLAELAVERDARMIVVGTRGERPIAGALLGSTPHRLLHLADRPVVVVPG